jgi:hypothetical protein
MTIPQQAGSIMDAGQKAQLAVSACHRLIRNRVNVTHHGFSRQAKYKKLPVCYKDRAKEKLAGTRNHAVGEAPNVSACRREWVGVQFARSIALEERTPSMNRIRQIILFLGLAVVATLCLYPPYQQEQKARIINRESGMPDKSAFHVSSVGHRWIWNPPQSATENDVRVGSGRVLVSSVTRVNWLRLGVYVGLTIAITLGLTFGMFHRGSG